MDQVSLTLEYSSHFVPPTKLLLHLPHTTSPRLLNPFHTFNSHLTTNSLMDDSPILPAARLPAPFLKWPPEIRNEVYGTLFECNSRMLLFENHHWPRATPISSHPKFDIQFLRVCRQITEEATGVLYSRNKFLVPDYASNAQNLMTLMVQWLERIGKQRGLIRHVLLDLKHFNGLWHGNIDICPLMRQIWHPSAVNAVFRFLLSNIQLSSARYPDTSIQPVSYQDAPELNRLITYLSSSACPFRSWRLLEIVTIPFDGSSISLQFFNDRNVLALGPWYWIWSLQVLVLFVNGVETNQQHLSTLWTFRHFRKDSSTYLLGHSTRCATTSTEGQSLPPYHLLSRFQEIYAGTLVKCSKRPESLRE